jgi:hypothetical protein
MPIEYQETAARFREVVEVAEADGLREWLQQNPQCNLDLAACVHLHAANLQVLMAARPVISHWPEDQVQRTWLESALRD